MDDERELPNQIRFRVHKRAIIRARVGRRTAPTARSRRAIFPLRTPGGIYALEVLSIDSIGPLYKQDAQSYAWAQVRLQFLHSGAITVHPDVRLGVTFTYYDGSTVQQMHETIFDAARQLIIEAAKVLSQSDSAELRRFSREIEDRQARPEGSA